jgi:hypothetical protein
MADNPSVFPIPARTEDDGVMQISFPGEPGMTLRDYFAAHAPPPPSGWVGTAETLERLSRPDGQIAALMEWRWFYADSMLAARELPKQQVVS